MRHSSKHSWIRHLHQPWFTVSITLIGVLLCCLGLLLLAGYFSKLAFVSLQQGDFVTAQAYSQKSLPIVKAFNLMSLGLIPDLVVWQEVLKLPVQAQVLATGTVTLLETSLQADSTASIEQLSPSIKTISASVSKIEAAIPKTFFLKNKVPEEFPVLLSLAQVGLSDIEMLIESVSQGKQTWVILLQNSDEIRATGGFAGSYVLLNFDAGVLKEIVVEDIYDADGQFTGYIPAPPGIREYTSSDRGLRLPDANWWPDFPESAQTMLQFFALGDKRNIAGVVAINLSTAKSILSVTGPLWLPDYNIEVTQENVGEVLRAERSEFFPGSTQKKHMLQLTLTQLKQKITELTPQQQRNLFESIRAKIQQKEVQLFSTQPHLQEIFSKYFVTGELSLTSLTDAGAVRACHCEPITIALVESNVGINKVNKYVTRENSLHFENNALKISTEFTNNAAPMNSTELSELVGQPTETQPRNGNGYLNYYRLFISPEYRVKSISVGNAPVTSWDEEKITTTAGMELVQIGVLLGIPEKSATTITFELTHAQGIQPEAVVLYKQSGIPPSRYTITTPLGYQEFELLKDEALLL